MACYLVCVWGGGASEREQACAHMEAREDHQVFTLLYHSQAYSLETGFLSEPGARLAASKPQ